MSAWAGVYDKKEALANAVQVLYGLIEEKQEKGKVYIRIEWDGEIVIQKPSESGDCNG